MPTSCLQKALIKNPLKYGTEGQTIDLVSNFYKINTSDVVVFHYDIDIRKEKPKSNKGDIKEEEKRQLESDKDDPITTTESTSPTPSSGSNNSSDEVSNNLDRFIKKFSPEIVGQFIHDQGKLFNNVHYVYDKQKNLYTVKMLDFDKKKYFEDKVVIKVDNRYTEFIVKIKLVERNSLNDVLEFYSGIKNDLSERIVSIFEIIFRFVINKNYESFQRKFFDLQTIKVSRNVNLVEFIDGFTTGVRMCEFGLALNMHIKTSCVVSSRLLKLVDLVQAIINLSPNIMPSLFRLKEANKFIRHLKMYTNHSVKNGEKIKINYNIDCLVNKSPRELKFTNRNGQTVSIADYFQEVYKINVLEYPLVKTTGKNCRYLPLELCFLIENQFLSNSKINSNIQVEMLEYATHKPNEYFNMLDSVVKKVAKSDIDLQKQFGITLNTEPVGLKGRILNLPRQLNANNNDKFYSVGNVQTLKWGLFCLDPNINEEQLKSFVNNMIDKAHTFGLNFARPNPCVKIQVKSATDLHNAIYNVVAKTQSKFLFIGIPSSKLKFVYYFYSFVPFSHSNTTQNTPPFLLLIYMA